MNNDKFTDDEIKQTIEFFRSRTKPFIVGDFLLSFPKIADMLDQLRNSERIYPCDQCGKMRSKDEGGTIFTVCDDCWSNNHNQD